MQFYPSCHPHSLQLSACTGRLCGKADCCSSIIYIYIHAHYTHIYILIHAYIHMHIHILMFTYTTYYIGTFLHIY